MGIFAVQACTKDGETEAVGQEGFVIAADRVGAVELYNWDFRTDQSQRT